MISHYDRPCARARAFTRFHACSARVIFFLNFFAIFLLSLLWICTTITFFFFRSFSTFSNVFTAPTWCFVLFFLGFFSFLSSFLLLLFLCLWFLYTCAVLPACDGPNPPPECRRCDEKGSLSLAPNPNNGLCNCKVSKYSFKINPSKTRNVPYVAESGKNMATICITNCFI